MFASNYLINNECDQRLVYVVIAIMCRLVLSGNFFLELEFDFNYNLLNSLPVGYLIKDICQILQMKRGKKKNNNYTIHFHP